MAWSASPRCRGSLKLFLCLILARMASSFVTNLAPASPASLGSVTTLCRNVRGFGAARNLPIFGRFWLKPGPRRSCPRLMLQTSSMSAIDSTVSAIEQAFETSLIAVLPDAGEQEMEELQAILTTSTRSILRRLKQGRDDPAKAYEIFYSSLRLLPFFSCNCKYLD